MSGKLQQLQHSSLNTLHGEQVAVAAYRVKRVKLRGHVLWFDRYVVLLKNLLPRMVCERAISTLLPACIGNAPTTHASA